MNLEISLKFINTVGNADQADGSSEGSQLADALHACNMYRGRWGREGDTRVATCRAQAQAVLHAGHLAARQPVRIKMASVRTVRDGWQRVSPVSVIF